MNLALWTTKARSVEISRKISAEIDKVGHAMLYLNHALLT